MVSQIQTIDPTRPCFILRCRSLTRGFHRHQFVPLSQVRGGIRGRAIGHAELASMFNSTTKASPLP